MKKNKLILITIFSLFLLLFGINGVKAKEKLNCDYEASVWTGQYHIYFYRNLTFELDEYESVLIKDIEKVQYSSDCNSHYTKLGKTKEEAAEFCKNKETDKTNDKEIKFDIYEGADCPTTLDIAIGGQNYKLQSSNRTAINESNSTETRRPKVSCGNVTCIPKVIPRLTSLAFTIIQIVVPILLIIMGSIDLFKGITAGKEDEMKKGQQMFIKRLIVGALVFFVIAIVKLLVSVVANSSDTANISSCISCFMSNDCKTSTDCN